MQPTAATAQLSAQVWRHVVIVAAMVSALVGGVVAVGRAHDGVRAGRR
jgi:hypothetical protein